MSDNILGKEKFIERAKKKHGEKYNYNEFEYINRETKGIIICPEHGPFEQAPRSHYRGGCEKCAHKKKSQSEVLEEIKEIHGDLYDYSQFIYHGALKKSIIICRKHGPFEQVVASHLIGRGCGKCANNITKTVEQFIKEAKNIFGEIYDYSKFEYITAHIPSIIICPIHGEFHKSPKHHILRKQGCPCCIREKCYSKKAIDWLETISKDENIHIQHAENGGEMKIKTNNGGYYSFDGYCPETNTVFEFYGCEFHGCTKCTSHSPNCSPKKQENYSRLCKDTYYNLYCKTLGREDFIKSKGFNLRFIYECEWDELQESL